jgi:biotin operon repressor
VHSAGHPVTPLTVQAALAERGALADVGGPAKLAQLVEVAAIPHLVPAYIDLLLDARAKRELLAAAATLTLRADQMPLPALLSDLQRLLQRLEARRAGPHAFLPPVPLSQLFLVPPPEPEWLVQDLLLAAANGWIGAPAKVGKSWIALDLLLACALGEPWLGHFKIPRPLRVVLVEEEDSAWRVYHRVKRLCQARGLGQQPPDTFRVHIRTGLKIDDASRFEPFRRWVGMWRPDLVVWDVFNQLHSREERRPGDIMPVLWALDTLRNDFGTANLVAHHSRKPGTTGPDLAVGGQRLRGPSEFWGWAENSLYLTPLKARGAILVEPESKDAGTGDRFKAHLADLPSGARQWCYDGVIAAKVEAGSKTRDRIVELLHASPGQPLSTQAIADGLSVTSRTIKRHLGALEADGVLTAIQESQGSAHRKLWTLTTPDESGSSGDEIGHPPF